MPKDNEDFYVEVPATDAKDEPKFEHIEVPPTDEAGVPIPPAGKSASGDKSGAAATKEK